MRVHSPAPRTLSPLEGLAVISQHAKCTLLATPSPLPTETWEDPYGLWGDPSESWGTNAFEALA